VARTQKRTPTQGPPLQFRPGVQLEELVQNFATTYGLQPNEACKALVALAVTEMDCRFYKWLRQLATAMGGPHAFVLACAHVHAAVDGAGRMRGAPLLADPERARFILHTVRDFLASRGLQVDEAELSFLGEAPVNEQGETVPELIWQSFQRVPERVRVNS
jgi:hypothetical protein